MTCFCVYFLTTPPNEARVHSWYHGAFLVGWVDGWVAGFTPRGCVYPEALKLLALGNESRASGLLLSYDLTSNEFLKNI